MSHATFTITLKLMFPQQAMRRATQKRASRPIFGAKATFSLTTSTFEIQRVRREGSKEIIRPLPPSLHLCCSKIYSGHVSVCAPALAVAIEKIAIPGKYISLNNSSKSQNFSIVDPPSLTLSRTPRPSSESLALKVRI